MSDAVLITIITGGFGLLAIMLQKNNKMTKEVNDSVNHSKDDDTKMNGVGLRDMLKNFIFGFEQHKIVTEKKIDAIKSDVEELKKYIKENQGVSITNNS